MSFIECSTQVTVYTKRRERERYVKMIHILDFRNLNLSYEVIYNVFDMHSCINCRAADPSVHLQKSHGGVCCTCGTAEETGRLHSRW